MSSMTWRILVSTIFLTTYLWSSCSAQSKINTETVKDWADSLGKQIDESCSVASGLRELQDAYDKSTRNIETIDGKVVVAETAKKIQSFLDIRLDAVKKLKARAQNIFRELHSSKSSEDLSSNEDNTTIPITNDMESCDEFYYNSKTISLTVPLRKGYRRTSKKDVKLIGPPQYLNWSRYYPVPVSKENSSVHVPTNIYECAPKVLENVTWTEQLDPVFKENYEKMPSSWQFFASTLGFMRFYPGAKWPNDNSNDDKMDIYDARMSGWYTQGASLPKNIIILLDISGSMTGLRLEIAKTTVKRILQSLLENDYFNIIAFKNDSIFIDPCELSNGTLLQATAKNKRRLIEALPHLETSEIADFDKAFKLAFEVLIQANTSGRAGGFNNNAIMLITDGAPAGYEQVFEYYNWTPDPSPDPSADDTKSFLKWLRVFTYLIGNEVTQSNKKQVQWMACANKGYFYHIATMADVHEYVQDYISVMARPLVINNVHHYAWTGVHLNLPADADGYSLAIAVSMPVYMQLKKKTPKLEKVNGTLLGVVGAEVMLKELLRLIPLHKLGVHGYAFIINNNGFVVIHPDHTPLVPGCGNDAYCTLTRESNPELKTGKPKPDYQNVDITYLEQEVNPGEGKIVRLREMMINRKTDSITAKVKRFHNKDKLRSFVVTQTYYFTPIKNTPYSLAVVMAEEPVQVVKSIHSISKKSYLQSLEYCRLDIADWSFCDVNHTIMENFFEDTNSGNRSISLLKYMLALNYTKDACDEQAVSSLLYDAEVTRAVLSSWEKHINQISSDCKNFEYKCILSQKLDFDFLVVGTRTGLTRYQEIDIVMTNVNDVDLEDSCPSWMRGLGAIEASVGADYYKRAAVGSKDHWVFEVPYSFIPYDNHTTIPPISGSRALYIQHNQRDIMMAAMAVNINFQSFFDMMAIITSFCRDGTECNVTNCANEDLECYLLDDNGYVLVSEKPEDIGRSFMELDSQIMMDLNEKGLYETIHMLDFQALCKICNPPLNMASTLLNPFKYIYRSLWWVITKVAMFAIQFSLYDWWQCMYYASASADLEDSVINYPPEPETIAPCTVDVITFHPLPERFRGRAIAGSASVCHKCDFVDTNSLDDLAELESDNFTMEYYHYPFKSLSLDNVDWENIRARLDQSPCIKDQNHYTQGGRFEASDSVSHCLSCTDGHRSYVVTKVPHTNLYLLALAGECKCDNAMRLDQCNQPEAEFTGCSEETMFKYRQPPSHKQYRNQYREDETVCGRSSFVAPSLLFTLTLQLILMSLNR